MQYSRETQEEVIEALKNGSTAKEIHEITGISLATIYRWRDENSQETEQIPENSQERLNKIADFLKKFLAPQLDSDIKVADRQLSEASGISEKVCLKRLEKLQQLRAELDAL
jgi:glycerol dehydrogenase-like iron-containing ADH family enzyme